VRSNAPCRVCASFQREASLLPKLILIDAGDVNLNVRYSFDFEGSAEAPKATLGWIIQKQRLRGLVHPDPCRSRFDPDSRPEQAKLRDLLPLHVDARQAPHHRRTRSPRRENHAKILVGVAMIHQCQTSEVSAAKFKALLEEFYSDSPERLNAALFGLTLTVKKPASDTEQD
jgi:hypothetical protein